MSHRTVVCAALSHEPSRSLCPPTSPEVPGRNPAAANTNAGVFGGAEAAIGHSLLSSMPQSALWPKTLSSHSNEREGGRLIQLSPAHAGKWLLDLPDMAPEPCRARPLFTDGPGSTTAACVSSASPTLLATMRRSTALLSYAAQPCRPRPLCSRSCSDSRLALLSCSCR